MKNVFVLLALAILAVSCSKEKEQTTPTDKLYPVKFSTQLSFSPEDYHLKSGSDTIHNPDTSGFYYRYVVYKTSGQVIKQGSGNGCEINESLPMGDYYIGIAGSKDAGLLNPAYRVGGSTYSSDFVTYPKAFYNNSSFTVGNAENNAPASVYLERMWGELELKILDRATCYLPSDKSIRIRVEGCSPAFFMKDKAGSFDNSIATHVYTSEQEFRNNETIPCLVSYSTEDHKIDVYLDMLSADSAYYKSVHLASPTIKRNVKTILSGSLGTVLQEGNNNNGNGSIGLKLEEMENWGEEIIGF